MKFVTKRDKGEGGVKNWHFLRDVIFEWPLTCVSYKKKSTSFQCHCRWLWLDNTCLLSKGNICGRLVLFVLPDQRLSCCSR